MKTLELSDELYDFLKECQEKMKTQDNRCTRNPIYTIWHKVKEYGFDGDYASDFGFYWNDDFFHSSKELLEFLYDNCYEDELENVYKEVMEDDMAKEEDFVEALEIDRKTLSKLTDYVEKEIPKNDLEDLFQTLVSEDIKFVYYRKKAEQVHNGGCFSFFEEDAFDHIKMNKHNISGEPYTYADSLYRAPRMEKLMKALKEDIIFE